MRALSVPQPWAWAIARGHETYVDCGFDTAYRGPLAIYASGRADAGYAQNQAIREVNGNSADPVAAIGGIVAVVSLEAVCTAGISGRPCGCGTGAWPGSYHWLVADPRPPRLPVLALGQPGLWELAPAVAAGVARMAGMPELARLTAVSGLSATRGPSPASAQLDSLHSGT
jgi:hypothetical protein